ncbi:MAG: DUF6452 family protein [Polaribacter sp.]|uniref:DUF6452 family protein n=1 Tax=Polaribacter sp. TaxID=1920175 RepID=UPI003BB08756
MRKIIAILFASIFIISACEKDDFCTQNPVTPKLILRFYDATSRNNIKSASGLYVWADTKDSLYVNISTDSLVIPLNSNTNQTIYNIAKGNIVEQFTINYTPENKYVSRSCGFKVIFNQATYTANNTWFSDISVVSSTIDNQNKAHVQIFH